MLFTATGASAQGVNQAPIAAADITPSPFVDAATGHVAGGVRVTLDGSASSDPDGDDLTYAWTQVVIGDSPTVTLSDATAQSPSFTTPAAMTADQTLLFQLVVTDPDGLSSNNTALASVTVLSTASNANNPPVASATPLPDLDVAVGASFTIDVAGLFSDPDGDTLTYTVETTAPTTASVAISGNTLTVTGAASGTPQISVIATDPDGGFHRRSFLVTVTAVAINLTPTISGTPATTVAQGELYSFTPEGVDANAGDTLTYSITTTPSWAAFNTATGTLTGTPTNADVGITSNIVISVSDGTLSAELDAFDLEVTNANAPPAVTFTPSGPQTLNAGSSLTITAVASPADAGPYTYAWTVGNRPTGVTISGESTSSLTIITASNAQVSPNLQILLRVIDSAGATTVLTLPVVAVNAAPANQAPIAAADITPSPFVDAAMGHVAGGVRVTLDGSASSDPDGDDLTYAWTQVAIGNSPTVTLSDATAQSPSFTTPAAMTTDQTLLFQLVVTDPDGLSSNNTALASVTVLSTASNANNPPVASATPLPDLDVAVGASFTIDVAGLFSDPDGDTLTYTVETTAPTTASVAISGNTLTVTGAASGTPQISVIATDPDGGFHRRSFLVTVTAVAINLTPTISGTPATTVAQGELYSFTPEGADANAGDTLTYSITTTPSWAAFNTTTGTLTGTPTNADVGITSNIVISVSDGTLSAELDAFDLEVTNANAPPAVTFTPSGPQTLNAGSSLTITAVASPADAGPYTYAWTVGNRPTGVTISGESTSSLTIITASNAQVSPNLQILLRVIDSAGATTVLTLPVVAVNAAPANQAPIAAADITPSPFVDAATGHVAGGVRVTLDGSASSDPDGDDLTYAWTQVAIGNSPTVTLSDATAQSPSFTTPAAMTTDQTLLFQLVVTDPDGLSSNNTAHASVTVSVGDSPTTFTQIEAQSLTLAGGGQTLDVSGNFADPDSDDLTYAATSATESVVTVSIDASSGQLTLTPVAAGSAVIEVTAQDGSNPAATQSFTVSVGDSPSTANAGPDQTVDEGVTVTLDGSKSSDPDGALTYTWTQTKGTLVTLNGANTVSPTFTAPVRQTAGDGKLVFQLVVHDGDFASAPDTVTITVTSDVSVQKTVESINRFLHTRTNLILANQPKLSRRINRLQRGVGSEQLSFATGEITKLKPFEFNLLSLGSGNYKLATSLDQVTRAADHLQVTKGGKGTHERSRFDVWFEASFNKFNGSVGSSGDFALAYLGADYLVSPDLLVGGLLQYDRLTSSAANENTEGTGWMAGPYVTARLQDNLYLDARLAWGTSDNDIRPPDATYTDSFKSTRRLANISLSGEVTQGDWIIIRPNASLSYMADKQKAYTNSLGDSIPGQTVSSGQFRFGPNFSTQFLGDNGWVYEPSFTLDAIYSHANTSGGLGTTPSPEDGWRARLEAGLGMTLSETRRLSFTGNYDGIGQSSFEAWGLGLNLDMKF